MINLPLAARPRFIYAHFLIPHHPYVFDINGNRPSIMDNINEKEMYLGQLLYTNKEIEKTIDKILSKSSKRKPIIIIQGDHGAYELGKSEIENKKIRMSILNAFFITDSVKNMLYDSISPVNSFRIILNYYYKQNLRLLPDINYFSNAEDNLKIEDVTELLKQ